MGSRPWTPDELVPSDWMWTCSHPCPEPRTFSDDGEDSPSSFLLSSLPLPLRSLQNYLLGTAEPSRLVTQTPRKLILRNSPSLLFSDSLKLGYRDPISYIQITGRHLDS